MTSPLGTCKVWDCYNYSYHTHGYCGHHWNLICIEDEKNENILKISKEIELLKKEIQNLKNNKEKND